MEEDRNAFNEQVNDGDEEQKTGAVDPGYSDEAEASAVEHENAEQEDPYSVKKRLH